MTIPAELQRSAPRPVSLTSEGRATLLYRGVVFALLLTRTWFLAAGGHSSQVRGTGWILSDFPVWLLLLIATAVSLWSTPRRMILLRDGRAAVARITGVARTWIPGSKGMSLPWWCRSRRWRGRMRRVQCEYTLLNGSVCKTTIKIWVDAGTAVPAAGTEVTLLYDRDEPTRAVIYPQPLLKVV